MHSQQQLQPQFSALGNSKKIIQRRLIKVASQEFPVYYVLKEDRPFHFVCRTSIETFLDCSVSHNSERNYLTTERFNLTESIIGANRKTLPFGTHALNVFFSIPYAVRFLATKLKMKPRKPLPEIDQTKLREMCSQLRQRLLDEFPNAENLNATFSELVSDPQVVARSSTVSPTVANSSTNNVLGKRPLDSNNTESSQLKKPQTASSATPLSWKLPINVSPVFCFPKERTTQIGTLMTKINDMVFNSYSNAWKQLSTEDPDTFKLCIKIFGPPRFPKPAASMKDNEIESCYLWTCNEMGLIKYLNPNLTQFPEPICSDEDQVQLAMYATRLLAHYKNDANLDPKLRERYELIATSQLSKLHFSSSQ